MTKKHVLLCYWGYTVPHCGISYCIQIATVSHQGARVVVVQDKHFITRRTTNALHGKGHNLDKVSQTKTKTMDLPTPRTYKVHKKSQRKDHLFETLVECQTFFNLGSGHNITSTQCLIYNQSLRKAVLIYTKSCRNGDGGIMILSCTHICMQYMVQKLSLSMFVLCLLFVCYLLKVIILVCRYRYYKEGVMYIQIGALYLAIMLIVPVMKIVDEY